MLFSKAYSLLCALALATFSAWSADTIRDYNPPTDYNPVMALCAQSWSEFAEPNEFCAQEFLRSLIGIGQLHAANRVIPNMAFKVLEQDEKVIGFIIAAGTVRVAADAIPVHSATGELAYIAIDHECQRSGYGIRLLDEAKDQLIKKGCHTLLARMKASNVAALKWAKKIGFYELVSGQATNMMEEYYRIDGEALGYVVIKLDLVPNTKKPISNQKMIAEYAQTLKLNAAEKKLKAMLQSKIASLLALHISELVVPEVNLGDIVRIVTLYFGTSYNRKETMASALYVLGKEFGDRQALAQLDKIFTFVDENAAGMSDQVQGQHQDAIIAFYDMQAAILH